MPSQSKHPKLVLTDEERQRLDRLRTSRTAPARDVFRARILWRYHAGETVTEIARALNTTRVSVLKWVDKALQMGVEAGTMDTFHKPREAVIIDDAKAWVVHLACCKPKDLGYAAELWTRSALARHVRKHAAHEGYPALAKAAKATVQRILAAQELQPHKVKYYLERRDPDFKTKMRIVLTVYQEVAMQNEARDKGVVHPAVITVAMDEKPGVQAIGNTAPDLPPVPGKHPTVSRDHEYVRFGTLSILASLDLHDGHVIARVEESHRSAEFICLLKDMDAYYPPDCSIRIILDNHSAHLSKETRSYLAEHPNRFKYVLTPTHGSWLNIAETLFGKMARTFLKHIRVGSKQELKDRIVKGIAEINEEPVVHRWKAFDALKEDADIV
ncbi:MAG: IS630 family transposase [Bryobacterales bacterium]|nr:IS630 family transposase [Bryobacterales bacterium]